jgi:hypothetical protein
MWLLIADFTRHLSVTTQMIEKTAMSNMTIGR